MTRFSVLVIVPLNTDDLKGKVESLMLPYYSYLKVKPYKIYLDKNELEQEVKRLNSLPEEELTKLAEDCRLDKSDLESLALIELEWFDEMTDGVDENGPYKLIDINPQGKWDFYRIIDTKDFKFPCRVDELPEILPYAVITPDGDWHELGENSGLEIFVKELKGKKDLNNNQEIWRAKLIKIRSEYSDYLAVMLYCHD